MMDGIDRMQYYPSSRKKHIGVNCKILIMRNIICILLIGLFLLVIVFRRGAGDDGQFDNFYKSEQDLK